MAEPECIVRLVIDTPTKGMLSFTLFGGDGKVANEVDLPNSGPVDNVLLTVIDNLLRGSNMDKFALKAVEPGPGIDKSSSLYRIIQSFAAAVSTCLPEGKASR